MLSGSRHQSARVTKVSHIKPSNRIQVSTARSGHSQHSQPRKFPQLILVQTGRAGLRENDAGIQSKYTSDRNSEIHAISSYSAPGSASRLARSTAWCNRDCQQKSSYYDFQIQRSLRRKPKVVYIFAINGSPYPAAVYPPVSESGKVMEQIVDLLFVA